MLPPFPPPRPANAAAAPTCPPAAPCPLDPRRPLPQGDRPHPFESSRWSLPWRCPAPAVQRCHVVAVSGGGGWGMEGWRLGRSPLAVCRVPLPCAPVFGGAHTSQTGQVARRAPVFGGAAGQSRRPAAVGAAPPAPGPPIVQRPRRAPPGTAKGCAREVKSGGSTVQISDENLLNAMKQV